MEHSTIRVYDPTAEPQANSLQAARRRPALQGATIGVLDNGKANAGMLMGAVAVLKQRHGVRR